MCRQLKVACRKCPAARETVSLHKILAMFVYAYFLNTEKKCMEKKWQDLVKAGVENQPRYSESVPERGSSGE